METESVKTAEANAKRWLFQVDYLEYYVLCSECYWTAGDQWTGFSGDDFSREEKAAANLEAVEHWKTATECDRCKNPLIPFDSSKQTSCPMQDDCSKVPGNTHWYYPGDCKRWEECEAVYAGCRQYANDDPSWGEYE